MVGKQLYKTDLRAVVCLERMTVTEIQKTTTGHDPSIKQHCKGQLKEKDHLTNEETPVYFCLYIPTLSTVLRALKDHKAKKGS